MPLPQKRWIRIADLAQLWSLKASDMEYYALDEQLQLAVFVVDLPAELGTWEGDRIGEDPVLQDLPLLNGPQPLLRASLLQIFRDGFAEVRAFRTAQPRVYLHVRADGEALTVRKDDLIVTREERERFEREHGAIAVPDAPVVAEISPNGDFSKIRVGGEWHSFGPKQAAVLRLLKLASDAGDPWRDGKRLLGDVGSTTLRLGDLFKRRSVWRQLVHADGKGSYRLRAQVVSPDDRRMRLFRGASYPAPRAKRTAGGASVSHGSARSIL